MNKDFPILSVFLKKSPERGLIIDGSNVLWTSQKEQETPSLRHYFANDETDSIIQHNIRWASGEENKPRFQFAYLMLPTACNQSCSGCFMGQDKKKLPSHLDGPFFTQSELLASLQFLKEHGASSVVYGGGGELFTWKGAFDFIDTISTSGLKPVIFTNGTLLSKDDVFRLNSLGSTLIISLRDTTETMHNSVVKCNGFRSTLSSIEYALEAGMNLDGRLAVEVPVTVENEDRIVNDFLPVMRALNIVPMVEEYIQLSVSDAERKLSHNFDQARTFFERLCECDRQMGLCWRPEQGSRMIAQPQCRRPLYSFAIFPSRDVLDCPSHSTVYGNLHTNSLEEIIYSEEYKRNILNFELCACSVFYTPTHTDVPDNLPQHLAVFR